MLPLPMQAVVNEAHLPGVRVGPRLVMHLQVRSAPVDLFAHVRRMLRLALRALLAATAGIGDISAPARELPGPS